MQRTRLSTLVDTAGNQFNQLASNPWRRISLSFLSLFFGFFIGQALATTAGQTAVIDVVGTALTVLTIEIISMFSYSRRQLPRKQRALWLELLNIFKIGVTYGLILEAFKIGS